MSATGIAQRLTSGGSLLPRANVRELFSCCFGQKSVSGDDTAASGTLGHAHRGDLSSGDPYADDDERSAVCSTDPACSTGNSWLGSSTKYGSSNGGFVKNEEEANRKYQSSRSSQGSKGNQRSSSNSNNSSSKRHKGKGDQGTGGQEDSSSSEEDGEILQKYKISMQRSQSLHASLNGKVSIAASATSHELQSDIAEDTPTMDRKLLTTTITGNPNDRHGSRASSKYSSRHSSKHSLDGDKQSICTSSPSHDNEAYSNDVKIEITADNAVHQPLTPSVESPASYGSLESSSSQALAGNSPNASRHQDNESRTEVTTEDQGQPLVSSQLSRCGQVELSFAYDKEKAKLMVNVHSARDVPSKERGGASNTQVRLLLLPTKKLRQKTKIVTCEDDCPIYEQSFSFRVPVEECCSYGVRLRLYGCERMRRERMIGECVVTVAEMGGASLVEGGVSNKRWVALEARCNTELGELNYASTLSRTDSQSSTQSLQHGGMPELFLGLGYNGTTGRLSVEVIKGSNFRNMAMTRAPDTYVKLTLMSPNGQEIGHSKTSIRRSQPNPLYKETFMFQVALFQLADVTLMVSVYNKRNMKRKDMIGWFSLGYNNSGEEELSHWSDMRDTKGTQVCRWHILLEA